MAAIWTIRKGITPEALEAKRVELKERGLDLQGDSGTITHDLPVGKAVLAYTYQDGVLRIEMVECPWVERDMVKQVLQKWL